MSYKIINLENWRRKNHFNFFRNFTYPHYNLCANIEITDLYFFIKKQKISIFRAILYLTCKIANELPEYKQRIVNDKVFEYEIVSPSFTYMSECDELFGYCTVEFIDNWQSFDNAVKTKLEIYKNKCDMPEDAKRQDLLYITCIPWFSFTSFVHTINLQSVDTIPRIAWGKYFENNNKIYLPISIQAHHSLVDGIHIAKYFKKLEEYSKIPQDIFI